MIRKITKIDTDLNHLHIAITDCFCQLLQYEDFDEIKFPKWINDIYISTKLKNKLEVIHNDLDDVCARIIFKELIKIVIQNNRIEAISTRQICETYIDFNLMKSYYDYHLDGFIDKITNFFQSLYSNYVQYDKYNIHVRTTIKDHINDFNKINGRLCVFCGLENTKMIKGQNRPALDHWLPQSQFPFSAINFENLIPIGAGCNSKKDERIVMEDKWTIREYGYYPYKNIDGIKLNILFNEEPKKMEDLNNENINLEIFPISIKDKEIFSSWMKLFNIQERFDSYLVDDVFDYWQEEYEALINNPFYGLTHATNQHELVINLNEFSKSYPESREGYLIMNSWITYIINNSSSEFKNSLIQRFEP